MKKRVISLILAALLLIGATSAIAANAGSAEDPLISLSYITDTYIDSVIRSVRTAIDKAFASADTPGDTAALPAGLTSHSVGAGSTATLKTGGSITLLSGAAEIRINSGAVVNVTVGAETINGRLLLNNRFLACEDTVATVTFTAASQIAAEGDVQITGSVSPFTDVLPNSWFFNDVITATEKGLINGKTAATYEPRSSLTVAEAIKLAACLHQLHHDGAVTLKNSDTSPWYQSYVDYAKKNSIIDGAYANYTENITRSEFIHIFFHALPASEFAPINTIPDGAIPDVAPTDTYADEIYAFYRAGIVTGYTNTQGIPEHAFGADTTIARSEVAAVLTRMYDASARQAVALP